MTYFIYLEFLGNDECSHARGEPAQRSRGADDGLTDCLGTS